MNDLTDAGFDDEARRNREYLTHCREYLTQQNNDLSTYTSIQSAKDLNDILDALGYERSNLYGISYGSRLALTIMRDFPQCIRSAILDGVWGPEASLFDVPASSERALNTFFEECRTNDNCSRRYPDLETEFEELIEMLDQDPIELKFHYDTEGNYTGTVGTIMVLDVLLDGDRWRSIMFEAFYMSSEIPKLPRLIHTTWSEVKNDTELANEDTRRLIFHVLWAQNSISDMHSAVFCNEEYVFESEDTWDRVYEREYREYRLAFGAGSLAMLEECPSWRGDLQISTVESQPVHSEIPTLLFSGTFDPITPPSFADRVAASLNPSTTYHFEFPSGHGVFDHELPCPRDIARDFVNTPTTRPNPRCIGIMLESFELNFGSN